MENVNQEIVSAVEVSLSLVPTLCYLTQFKLITAANTPEVQLAAIHKFVSSSVRNCNCRERSSIGLVVKFVSDAGFNNPWCCVPRGPGSREQILGIYQWYREMSPTVHLKVESYGAWGITLQRGVAKQPKLTISFEQLGMNKHLRYIWTSCKPPLATPVCLHYFNLFHSQSCNIWFNPFKSAPARCDPILFPS